MLLNPSPFDDNNSVASVDIVYSRRTGIEGDGIGSTSLGCPGVDFERGGSATLAFSKDESERLAEGSR